MGAVNLTQQILLICQSVVVGIESLSTCFILCSANCSSHHCCIGTKHLHCASHSLQSSAKGWLKDLRGESATTYQPACCQLAVWGGIFDSPQPFYEFSRWLGIVCIHMYGMYVHTLHQQYHAAAWMLVWCKGALLLVCQAARAGSTPATNTVND